MPSLRPSHRKAFLQGSVPRPLLALNLLLALVYPALIAFAMPAGHPVLFSILIACEAYHLWQIIGYCATAWTRGPLPRANRKFTPPVDVMITVAGEPTEIVRQTATAALAMDYPDFRVFLLNDGRVAGKPNWREIEDLADELGITCITRTIPGGAKAGNINHALARTQSPFVAVFDADHVPRRAFLRRVMGHFADPKMGFVQTPQYYRNFTQNDVSRAAWDQQTLFFGPIMRGKSRAGAAFMCGTNMVIRRQALAEAGGMCEFNIAEDFLTSLFIHEKGWRSLYVPEVLAEGLAPEDFMSYYKQQFRWARGSLEVLFGYNPLFRRGLSASQKFQYLTSSSYYLSGLFVILNAALPLVFLFTGLSPLNSSTMTLAMVFIPYLMLNLYLLESTSNYTYSFRALAFSLSSYWLHLEALWAVLLRRKTPFAVTSKQQLAGNFLYLTSPQLAYVAAMMAGVTVAVLREGSSAAVITNTAWALMMSGAAVPFIAASSPTLTQPRSLKLSRRSPERVLAEPDTGAAV